MSSDDSDSDSKSSVSDVASTISARSSSIITLRVTTLVILPILSFLGFLGTWHLSESNGTLKTVFDVVAARTPKLPGTNVDLLRTYTGLAPIDRQLTVLVTFFAPVVDGKNDVLRLYSIFGLGQFGAAWTLMMLESLRVGNQRRLVSWVSMVGLIFQNITYAVTVPLWFMLHIFTSPVSKPFPGSHANSVLLVPSLDLKLLPVSIVLGYVVPSWLMSLRSPDPVSASMHQILIAFWQPFPVWTVFLHISLRAVFQSVGRIFTKKQSDKPVASQGTSYLGNAKHLYRFILGLCMVTHIPVLLIALIPSSIFQDYMPSLSKFANYSFLDIYVPYFPSVDYKVASLAEGVRNFLQWDVYIGSMAFILWAVFLHRNATTEKIVLDPTTSLPKYREVLSAENLSDGQLRRKLVGKIVLWCGLAGPVGAATALLWERDLIVKQKIKQGI